MTTDYAEERALMVEQQIAARGIRDHRVLEAMRVVPRHRFVPPAQEAQAYEDRPLPIGRNQTISQPYMVALMTELLEPQSEDTVLEIGAGSGYQAAVLARLAKEVITMERHKELAEDAWRKIHSLNIANIRVLQGDGSVGCLEFAPYNAIIITAASPAVPETLKEQLADGGRLVCPIGPRGGQKLLQLKRNGALFTQCEIIDCMFVPLIGKEGWDASYETRWKPDF